MITVECSGVTASGDPIVRATQTFLRPVVYLDHWALRDLSSEQALGDRFVVAMKATGGTLLISHMQFAEFSRVGDPRHARDAGALLDRVYPSVYFMELDLDKMQVLEAEHRNDPRAGPLSDQAMLQIVATKTADLFSPFSFVGLLAEVSNAAARVGEVFASSNKKIADMVLSQREDPKRRALARQFVPRLDRPKTRLVLEELLRHPIISDERFTTNDGADLQHAVVAVGYCDFVLLDARWQHRVEVARRRLISHEVPLQLAKCYSKPRGGLDTFLFDLSTWAP